jgi:hypothetical protein
MAIEAAKNKKLRGSIVPRENASEAAVVEGLEVIAVDSLAQTVAFFAGELELFPMPSQIRELFERFSSYDIDFADVRGQESAKRAMTLAAAGAHNLIMNAITEKTRGGETTTSSVRSSYLFTQNWEEYSVARPRGLNDNLDFLARDMSTEMPLLVRRGVSEPIDLLTVIDTTSAPEVDWSNPDLRLECFDLTNRVVSDDGNSANDLPIIVGIERYELDNSYALRCQARLHPAADSGIDKLIELILGRRFYFSSVGKTA